MQDLLEQLQTIISVLSVHPTQSKLAVTVSAACYERVRLQAKLAGMDLQIAVCKEQLSMLTKDLEERARVSDQNDGEGAGDEREAESGKGSDLIAGVDINGGAVEWLRLL